MPGAKSQRIFYETRLPNIAKTTRNRTLVRMRPIKNMIKRPALTLGHKRLRMEWLRKCMRTDMETD